MLFKLARQNILHSKGFFIAYMLTIASFFVITYNVANIEVILGDYLIDAIKLSGISINETFTFIKVFIYIVILLFATYITSFFVKRRSKEIALYKTLGLNNRNVLKIIMLENLIVISIALVIGIVIGALLSRVMVFFTFDLIGLQISDLGLGISFSGIINTLLVSLVVYLIISLIPIRTINKLSIIQLMINQRSRITTNKKPIISIILLIIFTSTLIYQSIFNFGVNSSLDLTNMSLYFVNAAIVAILIYRGLFQWYFVSFNSKTNKITNPSKLLSISHLASNLKSLYTMMSIITIVMAVVTVSIIASFGMINSFSQGAEETNTFSPIKYVVKDESSANKALSSVKKIDKNAIMVETYTYANAKESIVDDETAVTTSSVILMKQSDFNTLKSIYQDKVKVENNYSNPKEHFDCRANDSYDKNICAFLKNENHDLDDIKMIPYEYNLEYFGFFENLDPTKYKDATILDYSLTTMFVLNDDNEIFNELDSNFLINMTLEHSKANNFIFFDLVFKQQLQTWDNVVSLNQYSEDNIASFIVLGLFQTAFILIATITVIALMMAIFFRTLENIEKGLADYLIAKKLGMKQKNINTALFVESFISQVVPFLLGLVVSTFLFSFIIGPRLKDLDIKYTDLIFEPVTVTIFAIMFTTLITLLIIQLILVNNKIKKTKQLQII